MKEKRDKKVHIKLIEFFFKRPILKLIILLIIQFFIIRIPELFPSSFPIRLVTIVLGIILTIYFILVIIHVVRLSLKHLMNPKNLFYLIGAYILLILVILFVSSMLYNFVDLSHLGYIQYGNCNDNFNPSLINYFQQQNTNLNTTSAISKDFFYFSAVTFFTVGYGDICPMGFAKVVSILVAFMGNIISVILLAFIINNYLKKRESEINQARHNKTTS
jgi:potassium channel LctB